MDPEQIKVGAGVYEVSPRAEMSFSLGRFIMVYEAELYAVKACVVQNTVARTAVAMERPRDGRIYEGCFWTTARYTRSHC
jgi:hypothetical protein